MVKQGPPWIAPSIEVADWEILPLVEKSSTEATLDWGIDFTSTKVGIKHQTIETGIYYTIGLARIVHKRSRNNPACSNRM